jgi:carboxylesterase type B
LETDFLKIAPIAFNYKSWFPQKNLDKVSNEVRKFYFGDKPIDKDTFQNLTNLYSDANFVYGVWKLALSHATEKPVYPYFFTYQDETSQSLTCLITGRKELLGTSGLLIENNPFL